MGEATTPLDGEARDADAHDGSDDPTNDRDDGDEAGDEGNLHHASKHAGGVHQVIEGLGEATLGCLGRRGRGHGRLRGRPLLVGLLGVGPLLIGRLLGRAGLLRRSSGALRLASARLLPLTLLRTALGRHLRRVLHERNLTRLVRGLGRRRHPRLAGSRNLLRGLTDLIRRGRDVSADGGLSRRRIPRRCRVGSRRDGGLGLGAPGPQVRAALGAESAPLVDLRSTFRTEHMLPLSPAMPEASFRRTTRALKWLNTDSHTPQYLYETHFCELLARLNRRVAPPDACRLL